MACSSFSCYQGDMHSQSLPGQLQVTAYVTRGMLTVHVIQGRYLTDLAGHPCRDTYVKLSLIPDLQMRTFCETEVNCGSSCPGYNEKFSFELIPEDRQRRLLLSVWSLDASSKSHLVGCMSFGVRRLLESAKLITGWYYLLPAELGQHKHLQVQQVQDEEQVLLTDRYKVALRRSSEGYGMSLTGSCPVRISRILDGSPAQLGGLRIGDVIDCVNGHPVGVFSQDGVARAIKHSGNAVVLEVLRPVSVTRTEGSPWKPKKRHFHCNFNLLPNSKKNEPESKRPRISFMDEEPVMVVDAALQRSLPVTPRSIIKKRRSQRKSNRVSFSETVTCQPIMKVADIMELFNEGRMEQTS